MRLYVIILLLFLVSCTGKNNETDNKQKTYEKKDKEAVLTEMKFLNKKYDFGNVSSDTLLTARFDFINIGDNDLIIDYVNPDCTCTGYFLRNDTIAPGDSAYIELELATKNKYGEQKIYTTVRANTFTRFYKLTLTANVM